MLNDIEHEKKKVKKNKRIVVPFGAKKSECTKLVMDDLMHLDLEKKLWKCEERRIFYLSYNTIKGQILGCLRVFEDNIVFEPMDWYYKGFFDFQSEKLEETKKRGFILSYSDIFGSPKIMKLPDLFNPMEEDLTSVNLFIELVSVGSSGRADPEREMSVACFSLNI